MFPQAYYKHCDSDMRKLAEDLIHHSDRGAQYANNDYIKLLKKHNIRIRMTECGAPKDNAMAERVNGIIKNELLMGMSFFSIEEVRIALRWPSTSTTMSART